MKHDTVTAVNETGAAFQAALKEHAETARKQADFADVTHTMVGAMLNGEITSDDKAKFSALVTKLSPPSASSPFVSPRQRPVANGGDKPSAMDAAE